MPDPIGGVQPFAELARGRTSTVYKGYQRDPGRFVLLKTVRPDDSGDDLVERLEEEARIAAQVRHPNVVEVYDAGRDGATAYLLTEFVEGMDLRALVERGPVPPALAAFILTEAAEGLAAVHAAGILHRDLKPANLLVSADGEVKLTDFGLASLVSAEGDTEMRGTLAYLAPEIVRGDPPTEASDLFSLGAVLAELLTGRAAFAREEDGDTLDATLHHDPVPALAADPRVPPALANLGAALLAKTPSQRLSAKRLIEELDAVRAQHPAEADDLAAFLHAPASYTPRPVASLTPAAATPKPSRRWTGWAIAAVLLMLAALGYAGIALAPDSDSPALPDTLLQVPLVLAPTDSLLGNEATAVPDSPPETASPEDFSVALDQGIASAPLPEPEDAPPPEPDSASATESPPPDVSPLPTGSLSIAAEPWARIRIDDEAVGTTPLAALTLPAGPHRITFENPEFPTHTVSVEVEMGEQEQVAVSLWDLVGRVTLIVSPWAEVRVNGVLWDTVPPQERPLILTPGEHRLAFVHPSLGTREVPLRIAAGESRTLRINLTESLP